MKRSLASLIASALLLAVLAAQAAQASVPAAITEHIADVAQWAYRGGTTRTYPSCERLCSLLWAAEHAPSASDPFATELWREMETLRERIEVLPRLGSILLEREMSPSTGTNIGVRIGEAPGHVIWLEVRLPAALPWTVLARGAAEPRKYVLNFRAAGASVGGVRVPRDAWVIGGRYGSLEILAEEFQYLCGPGAGTNGYTPPVGTSLMSAYGSSGCFPSGRSPVSIYTLPNPVVTPSEDYTSQTAPTTVVDHYYSEDPGARVVQERVTREFETYSGYYSVLIKWLDHQLGGTSDDPLDMEAALVRHEPLYRFDAGEDFFPQMVGAFTANFELDGEGNYALEDANQLNTGTSTLRAAAGSPGTGTLPQPLTLELLGEHYHDGTNDLSATEDNINARGDEVTTYEIDAGHMRELGYQEIVYGRTAVDPDDGKVWLQYWVFYYDNSWRPPLTELGQHEGDWEMIQIGLDESAEPDAVTFARHSTSDTWGCTWAEVEKNGGEDEAPVVYPGRGSHASYPHAGSTEIKFLQTDEHDGEGVSDQPSLHVLTREDDWMNWKGRWGASTGDFASPASPSQQGEKWTNPSRFQSEHLDPTDCER